MTPWTATRQAPLSMEFFRQEYWNGLPFPTPGDHPNPGMEPSSSALAGRFFNTAPPGKLNGCQFSCSIVYDFTTPWTTARQASLSVTNSWSLLKLMPIELVMPSNYLILCHPLLLPSIFPSIRGFSNKSILHIRWPKDCHFSFSISPSNEYSGLISFRID